MKPWPAAALSTAWGSRSAAAASCGGTGSGTRWARPARRCSAASRGRTTVRVDTGSNSPRSRSHCTGGAGFGVSSPYGGPQTSRSSTDRASTGAVSRSSAILVRSVKRPASAATAETGSWVPGSPAAVRISCSRPGDMPAVASATVGPRPVGEGCCGDGARSSRAVRTRCSRWSSPQTRACSRRVVRAAGSAAVIAAPASSRPSPSPWPSPVSSESSVSYGAGSGATASASAVCRAKRSRCSSARTTEARVPARVASWVMSFGTGLSRSGRARSSPASDSSPRARRASASVRGGVVVPIRPTVAPGTLPSGQGVWRENQRVGIESDQLVYDYLSRVGDLAQQQQLSPGARMRLVATLRGEIDRQRGTDGSDSPAVVRRILGRLGAPGELLSLIHMPRAHAGCRGRGGACSGKTRRARARRPGRSPGRRSPGRRSPG